MGETIEVRLNDQQHRQLVEEARQAGQKFFDYCRTKLTAGPIEPKPLRILAGHQTAVDVVPAPFREDDRISRIEDAVARLTDIVLQGQPMPEAIARAQSAETAPIDVDTLVDASFHEAEAAGLTEHVPDVNEEVMRQAGVRPLSRRPMPFSTIPRHLNGI